MKTLSDIMKEAVHTKNVIDGVNVRPPEMIELLNDVVTVIQLRWSELLEAATASKKYCEFVPVRRAELEVAKHLETAPEFGIYGDYGPVYFTKIGPFLRLNWDKQTTAESIKVYRIGD